MERKIRMRALALLLSTVLAGTCTGSVMGEESMDTENEIRQQIAMADNDLGKRLMEELAGEGENVFISSYSIATALSMLGNCSEKGVQIEQLWEFLGYGDMTQEEILEGQKLLMDSLSPDFGMDLSEEEKKEYGTGSVEIGNAIYIDNKLETVPEFERLPESLSAYGAEVGIKDLDTEQTVKEANAWVQEKTHDMIDSILDEPLSEEAALLLMNTVYFMGNWRNSFDEEATDIQSFYGAKGETEVSMMHQQERFAYVETDGYQIICLPYLYGYTMYLYLPKDKEDYKNWGDEGYLNSLADTEYEFEYREISLSMPKFELEYFVMLTDILKQMGLTEIFSDHVYDRISEQSIEVSSILHKTALKNDETGTEAAAVTAIIAETMALRQPETPVEVTIDRPFYFTITHNESGLNLFEGCIMQPE